MTFLEAKDFALCLYVDVLRVEIWSRAEAWSELGSLQSIFPKAGRTGTKNFGARAGTTF